MSPGPSDLRSKIAMLANDPAATDGERDAANRALKRVTPPADKRPQLNEAIVKALPIPKTGNKVYYFPGAILQGREAPRGFGVRVTSSGAKSFIINYRIKGRERRYTIGKFGDWTVLKAVQRARELRQEHIDRGKDPFDDRKIVRKAGTVNAVLDAFVSEYLGPKERRSADEYKRAFDRLVRPEIGHTAIGELSRPDVSALLRKIARKNGPVMADRCLAYLRKALRWWAANGADDNFVVPIVPGMAQVNAKERERDRVLTDEEIRDVWIALADMPDFYARLVRTLLLTTLRRDEGARLRWDEIENDALVIPASRRKNKEELVLPLTPAIVTQLGKRPDDVEKRPFVFAARNWAKPFSGFSKCKADLDAKINALRAKDGRGPMPHWTYHDLRRTGVTLMERAGVDAYLQERVVGHTVAGVRRVYARWDHLDAKRGALTKLDNLVAEIVKGKHGKPATSGATASAIAAE